MRLAAPGSAPPQHPCIFSLALVLALAATSSAVEKESVCSSAVDEYHTWTQSWQP